MFVHTILSYKLSILPPVCLVTWTIGQAHCVGLDNLTIVISTNVLWVNHPTIITTKHSLITA